MTTKIKENELKDMILDEINRQGSGTRSMWVLFFICVTPAILNGLQMSSYVFLGQLPTDYYCIITELEKAAWSYEHIRNISTIKVTNPCNILDWDYEAISKLSYSEANAYINSVPWPEEVYCKENKKNKFYYDHADTTIVAEWNLVCDREPLRPTVQMALSFGKFIGASVFGVVADKYGRKTSVTIGGILYIIFGPLAAVINSYWGFVVSRFLIGAAGSGVFHSAFTILTEFADPKYRSYLSILFNMPYPVGMMIMALIAYFIVEWRYFQLAISLPALLLIPHYFIFMESPRWLVNKGKLTQAYKIVFRKNLSDNYQMVKEPNENEHSGRTRKTCQLMLGQMTKNLKDGLRELQTMYGNKVNRKRLFICHFSWFTTSLAYYALALNGNNFKADEYIYVTITALTEIPSYFLPMLLFKCLGRRSSSILLFVISGVFLIGILGIPSNLNNLKIGIAIFARTLVSATFAILILHAAEMFPTEIRNSAIGISSTMSHIGSITAPYIANSLNIYGWWIPTTICGACCILSSALMVMQPETKDKHLDEETIK